jgi:hypothetical protein
MIATLRGLSFDQAFQRLEANGYNRIAEGDWAYAYALPDSASVIRLTPYDPAYQVFISLCWAYPHQHLPTIRAAVRLAGFGLAVELPWYAAGDPDRRKRFLADLQAAMERGEAGELEPLGRILRRGLAAGQALLPYFGEMDWNVENVLLDGPTPVLIDAFTYDGPTLTERIAAGLPVDLDPDEVQSFLSIPYHRRGQKQFGEA